ncbi:MAG: transglycosylase domain-containing protein [Oscillospiraceae bacterium]|jgi:penicillin-binding protein 1A|uniref:Penicillin-binding protein 1A n=1 Tax=Caproicibacterium lactatifermentans TaxID=2666138 RepID=A0A859DVR6_9FIRM|nr:transglycosylase domain-containing protein [Caproicibacterium lactatifermentans]MDD4807556.1 transglycosylase domain-containing protein [Oscillospiraceae bacterium]QKN24111.1 transglycosylase [Caproicibacterium lactatifermentans]
MKKTDRDTSFIDGQLQDRTAAAIGASVSQIIGKVLLTLLAIFLITLLIVGISLLSFIFSMKDEEVKINLATYKQTYTSYLYVNGSNDDKNQPVQKLSLHSGEQRTWVDYSKIPTYMKDAMVSIEDKRFWDHNGVDWKRTFSAMANLAGGSGNYGGSTITQQLIKNLTQENEVSLTRKVKEIFRALNMEKKYSKEQILEAYLNCVPFGSGTQGVQAAANLYFGKNIQDCDLAQCAAIAGITQNPAKYTPLVHRDNNRQRQQTVLTAMHDQKRITDTQYQQAVQESNHMTFVGKKAANNSQVWDWYTEAVIRDVQSALMTKYSCSASTASNMIYNSGIKIYSAEDQDFQKIAENYVLKSGVLSDDTQVQTGFCAVGYDGRVLATVGSRNTKNGNLVNSYATMLKFQSGSSVKPISTYGPALDKGQITYSSLVKDEKIENYFPDGTAGPNNYSSDTQSSVLHGNVTVQEALAHSYNCAAAQVCRAYGVSDSYNFMVQKLGFSNCLTKEDSQLLGNMALGGQTQGVTVLNMAAAYEIFGNGGKYYKPYTFYKVLDHNGNVILDNTQTTPVQAIQPVSASVMNRLLRTVVTDGTGSAADISGWDIVGKTGTTDKDVNSWFVGCTPYASGAVWTGYGKNKTLSSTQYSKALWRGIFKTYLATKTQKDFTFDSDMVKKSYCKDSGLLAGSGCLNIQTGYYDKNNLPAVCSSSHAGSGSGNGIGEEDNDTGNNGYNNESSQYSSDGGNSNSSEADSQQGDTSENGNQSADSKNENGQSTSSYTHHQSSSSAGQSQQSSSKQPASDSQPSTSHKGQEHGTASQKGK